MRIGNRRGCREKKESFINLTNYGKMDFSFECRGALLDSMPFEISQGLWWAPMILKPPFFLFTPSCYPWLLWFPSLCFCSNTMSLGFTLHRDGAWLGIHRSWDLNIKRFRRFLNLWKKRWWTSEKEESAVGVRWLSGIWDKCPAKQDSPSV